MKRKLTIKKKVVATTLKPKQLQNVTGGKKSSGGVPGPTPDSCSTRTNCYGM